MKIIPSCAEIVYW